MCNSSSDVDVLCLIELSKVGGKEKESTGRERSGKGGGRERQTMGSEPEVDSLPKSSTKYITSRFLILLGQEQAMQS